MLDIIKAKDRHFSDFGWLKTFWLFSFAEYYDPHNLQFGALRVFNDDIVEPGMGFPTHPHKEMEIITLVLEGEITHADSMGNKTVIKAGDVQRMSAGTGLTHSEFNLADDPVHFYQIWFYPDQAGLEPTYAQKSFPTQLLKNRLLPVASGQDFSEVVPFHTDATIYRSVLQAGHKLTHIQTHGRRVFVYLTSGGLTINGISLVEKEQARIDEGDSLDFIAESDVEFILIDVPSCKGWGYDSQTLRGAKKR
jgi:quercetin 2,3-dioxygenase